MAELYTSTTQELRMNGRELREAVSCSYHPSGTIYTSIELSNKFFPRTFKPGEKVLFSLDDLTDPEKRVSMKADVLYGDSHIPILVQANLPDEEERKLREFQDRVSERGNYSVRLERTLKECKR